MNNTILFSRYKLGHINLKNRIVMAPMTRSRAIKNIPNNLMKEYYEQRAEAGLIITEGTSPSPNGLGYSRIPGIYTSAQIKGWKIITEAVHKREGKIILQIMHTGRISHADNMPAGAEILSPSAITPAGQMWTDTKGLQNYPVPSAMSNAEIKYTILEYAAACKNAIKADFNGVELHCANGYLPEQFLSPHSNIRTDIYGGSIENRCRFILETVDAAINVIGKDRVGIRLSPYGIAGDMAYYPEVDDTYKYLAGSLNKRNLLYIHLADHSGMGAPEVPASIKSAIAHIFEGSIILNGGYTKSSAENELEDGLCDLVAFGKLFINNPDLVDRFKNNYPLSAAPDPTTFFSESEQGYTDYPVSVPVVSETTQPTAIL